MTSNINKIEEHNKKVIDSIEAKHSYTIIDDVEIRKCNIEE